MRPSSVMTTKHRSWTTRNAVSTVIDYQPGPVAEKPTRRLFCGRSIGHRLPKDLLSQVYSQVIMSYQKTLTHRDFGINADPRRKPYAPGAGRLPRNWLAAGNYEAGSGRKARRAPAPGDFAGEIRQTSGWALSDLFKDIQEKGIEAVKASMPQSTYYRQIKRLRAAGLAV